MKIEFLPIEESHLETIRKWRNSEEVNKYMYNENYITAEQQRNWYESIVATKDEKHWIVQSDDKYVGVVNIKKIDRINGNAEWAFYLGDIESRGKGAGVLIEYMLLDYAFNELKLNKLNCAVLSFNDKVIELHKKFGFVEEGILRKQIKKNAEYVDVVLLGMTRDEWEHQKQKLVGIIRRLTGNETRP